MSQIPSKRLETVLGRKPKRHAWAPQENRHSINTVTRDQRPAKSFTRLIITIFAAGLGVIIGTLAIWAFLFYLFWQVSQVDPFSL